MVKSKMRNSPQDKILYAMVYAVLALFLVAVLYPIIYVLSSSFSSGQAVMSGRVVLLPVEPGFGAYRAVFTHREVMTGYRNTIFYTAAGTLLNVIITMVAAYPLSRHDFPIRKPAMFYCTLTMFFSGGMIPAYLLVVDLGMINTVWAMLIPGMLSVYNMILARTFMQSSIPRELLEAAQIDGCSDAKYFFAVLLPLSKAVIAVITLYYAVAHWNSYFSAILYLNDRALYPLQLFLREILVSSKISLTAIEDAEALAHIQGMESLLKYALIVVSSVPIICMYPFVQRYFMKGVMIGSLKG